jgi:hypothetical protein
MIGALESVSAHMIREKPSPVTRFEHQLRIIGIALASHHFRYRISFILGAPYFQPGTAASLAKTTQKLTRSRRMR